MEESGYIAMLKADRSIEAAGRLEDLQQIPRLMEEYETLQACLEHISLVTAADQEAMREQVTIMTIHAAKALEFDHGFLACVVDGVFPCTGAMREGCRATPERTH